MAGHNLEAVMMASELIAELSRIVESRGDLPVRVAVPVEPGASVYVSSDDVDAGVDADGEHVEIVG